MATAIVAHPVQYTHPDLLALAHEISDDEGIPLRVATVLAELYFDELMAYAHGWDMWTTRVEHNGDGSTLRQGDTSTVARCPECGSAIVSRQYYVGGQGYRYFEVCSGDGSHYSRRD